MDNSIKISYFRYDYVIPLIIINLILLTLGMPWVEFSAVISLITLIIVIIGTRVTLSDRRKKIIEELKQDNFIDYVILSLKANCELYEKKVTQNYQVTASYQNLNKFSRAYPFLGRKLKKYDEFCKQIDDMITDSRNKDKIEQLRMKSKKLLNKFQKIRTKWTTKL